MTKIASGPRVNLHDTRARWWSVPGADNGPVVQGRGYAFFLGAYRRGQDLVAAVARHCQNLQADEGIARLKAAIPDLNGCWALVACWPDGRALAAVDRSRSVPLFYTDAAITSTPEHLVPRPSALDTVSAAELMLSAYVSGRQTIFEGVHQIQAGEWVEFLPGESPRPKLYFRCFPDVACGDDPNSLSEELEDVLEAIFARHAAALKGRRLILPLSGGYDSRLIGWLLFKHGIRNVLCYTYGVRTNPQVEIARRVAAALGFQWRFIPYNAQCWADCMAAPEMAAYWDYAGRGTASPHIQDFPAMFALHRKSDLGEAPVFLPGHVGDAWACEFAVRNLDEPTNHPPSEYHSSLRHILDPVVSAIIYRHLNLWPVSKSAWEQWPFSALADRLAKEVEGFDNTRDGGRWAFVEWVLRSRTANWIVNSGRAAEFFGGEFVLCLGDYALVDFFRKLPAEQLYARRLYAQTMSERVLNRPGCPVSRIPVLSGGSRASGLKVTFIRLLQGLRLYKPLDRLRRRPCRNRSLAADCWFTRGKPSHAVTVGQALEPYGVAERLPVELRGIIAPYLDKPAYSIQCNGLLAAVILASEFSSRGGGAGWARPGQ